MATGAHELSQEPSFGQMLRTLRMAAGLTQEALAERAGLSVRGISDLERDLKTRPRFETVRMLADALELDQSARAALISAARPSPVPATSAPVHIAASELPLQMTSLVGRERELTSVEAMIRNEGRLVTLTGPGGVGKTRLALRVASDLHPEFADGVTFIQLAAVADDAFVLPAVAQGLSIREDPGQPLLETLRGHLRDQRLLLVLDNCEHIVAGVQPLVAELLSTCAELTVLATSRAPLHLRSELLFPVPSLSLPNLANLPPLDDLGQIEAVALFVQRARAVRPDFDLSDDNAPVVAEICRRLDGLPLAIELAAARLRLLSPSALLALLNERLRLLVGGPLDAPTRHQTLEATIAGSYDLLDPDEQALFRRLSVFAGGCTFEAAMAASATDDEIATLTGLQALLDNSLLIVTGGANGERRFAMLDTIREFALHRLSTDDDEQAIRAHHAVYFLDLAERGERELTGPEQATWVKLLDADHDNFRASLSWSLNQQGEDDTALRLGAALWRFWDRRGYLREGRSWLTQTLSRSNQIASLPRANALIGLANLLYENFSRQRTLYAEGLALFEELEDKPGQARALSGLGLIEMDVGEYDQAILRFEGALEIWRTVGNRRGEATVLLHLGRLLGNEGEYHGAQKVYLEALAIGQEIRDMGSVAYCYHHLGRLARRQGMPEAAQPYLDLALSVSRDAGNADAIAYAQLELGLLALVVGNPKMAASSLRKALRSFVEFGSELGAVDCLDGCARLARMTNQPVLALQLWSVAATWRESVAASLPPLEVDAWNRDMATLRTELGDEQFSSLWSIGQTFSLQEGTRLALDLLSTILGTTDDIGSVEGSDGA
jgi:predicted ATPase/transcriptional regulator with XRE-family HTH domain